MALAPRISARWVLLAGERLAGAGIEVDRLLARAGIGRKAIADANGRIPFHRHAVFFEFAAEASGDPCFGLHFGSTIHPRQADLLGYVVLNSATLGQALRNLTRYRRIANEGSVIDVQHEGECAAIIDHVVDPRAVGLRQIIDMNLSAILAGARTLTRLPLLPARIEMALSAPADPAEYRRVFGGPVHFNERRSAIVLPCGALDAPVVGADPALLSVLERYCQELLDRAQASAGDIESRVQQIVLQTLPEGEPKIATVARHLNMSTRTLERRLQQLGRTFSAVREDLRRQLAVRYLGDPGLTSEMVAFLLGYSEGAAFTRAFSRWTGATPARFRRDLHQAAKQTVN
jgi:AraC-like DNA-binding protein